MSHPIYLPADTAGQLPGLGLAEYDMLLYEVEPAERTTLDLSPVRFAAKT